MKNRILILIFGVFALTACEAPATVKQATTEIPTPTTTTTNTLFAAGTKAVKINTHINGSTTSAVGATSSFVVPTSVPPTSTPIPSPYPGYDGSRTYHAGVSATQFFDVDGSTIISKPSWLQDFQLGITGISSGAGACATFGGAGTYDVTGYYRTSELECNHAADSGTGLSSDQVFLRLILDRTVIGTAENLMLQVEYQASGIRLNSDGVSVNPENNLDQLWKIFWNSTLYTGTASNVFSLFVPPNMSACLNDGSGATGAPGNCVSGYKGAPVSVKQIVIPLSAYPTMSVIQFSRMAGRINNTDTFSGGASVNYVSSFCTATDSPLCLGVVIKSVMLMRL